MTAASRMPSREALAEQFRDWIHEQSFSQCNMGSDTCPDWDMAYELADLVIEAGRDAHRKAAQRWLA